MTTVQPGSLLDSDEELGAVGVGSSVGHGQPAGAVMLELKVLIGELLAVDGAAAGAVASGEVASLDHELLDHAVELGAGVAVSVGQAVGELPEVGHRLGHGFAEEADLDAAGGLAADGDVEPGDLGDLERADHLVTLKARV